MALWAQRYQELLSYLHSHGHWADGDASPKLGEVNIGAAKRGMLNLARARTDILFSLPRALVEAVVNAGKPYEDRKVKVEFDVMLFSLPCGLAEPIVNKGQVLVRGLQGGRLAWGQQCALVSSFIDPNLVAGGGSAACLEAPGPQRKGLAWCAGLTAV